MPPEISRSRWKQGVGYAAFTVFSLILFLWLTFPYDVVERLVLEQARAAGLDLRIGSVGPGLFGVRFKAVQLLPRAEPGEAPDPTRALVVDRVSVRPSLFPVGVHVSASLLGGGLGASYGVLGDPSVDVRLDALSTQQGNFKGYTGIDMAAAINGRLRLDLPRTAGPGGKQPDLSAANGRLGLTLSGVQINGGTLTGSMPLDLPAARLGDLRLDVPFEKGVGTVEQLSGDGQDLQLDGTGTINLARRLDASRLDLQLRLRASEAFAKEQPLIGMGLNSLPSDRGDPSFHKASVTGTLSRLSFGPGR